jgi:hypothetical protein
MSFHIHPFQQDKWDFSEIIPKITNPGKHHGVHPVGGYLIDGQKMPAGATVFELKVRCPKEDCEYYLAEFNTQEWNERNPKKQGA